jgi:hypothetical protein
LIILFSVTLLNLATVDVRTLHGGVRAKSLDRGKEASSDCANLADAVDALDDRVERWARWRETRGDRRSAAADESSSTKTAAGRVSTRGRRLAVRMSLDDILMWSALALFVVGLVFGLLR